MLATRVGSTYHYSAPVAFEPPSQATIAFVHAQCDLVEHPDVQTIVGRYKNILTAYKDMHDAQPVAPDGTKIVTGTIEAGALAQLADDRKRMLRALVSRVAAPNLGDTIMLISKALLFKERIRLNVPFAPRNIAHEATDPYRVEHALFLEAEQEIMEAGNRLVMSFVKFAVAVRSSGRAAAPYIYAEAETLKALFPTPYNHRMISRAVARVKRNLTRDEPECSSSSNLWT